MKVVGYVSLEISDVTPIQKELLAKQAQFIKDHCKEKGYELLYIFSDTQNNDDFTAKDWMNLEDYLQVEDIGYIITLTPDRVCKDRQARQKKESELADMGTPLLYLDTMQYRAMGVDLN